MTTHHSNLYQIYFQSGDRPKLQLNSRWKHVVEREKHVLHLFVSSLQMKSIIVQKALCDSVHG